MEQPFYFQDGYKKKRQPRRNNHKEELVCNHRSKDVLSLALWLNLFFSLVELLGGLLINSTAIIADAFHDFMDALAIGLAILFEKISKKKRTTKFSYGFKRFSLLSALGLSIVLLVGSVFMFIVAFDSFVYPKEVHSIGMFWFSVLGLAINGFAFFRVRNGGVHGYGRHNHNSQSIMLHLLEDILGWVSVLFGATIIYFTGWNWLDGVLAICISLFIGFNATKNLINTLKVMLQSVPENVNMEQLNKELQKIEGIRNIHDVHVWSLDGSYNIGSLHAVRDKDSPIVISNQDIMDCIIKLMRGHNIHHTTVQIEASTNSCEFQNC